MSEQLDQLPSKAVPAVSDAVYISDPLETGISKSKQTNFLNICRLSAQNLGLLTVQSLADQALAGTGEIEGTLEVGGTGTAFLTEIFKNDVIKINNEYRRVLVVLNDTLLAVDRAFNTTAAGQTMTRINGSFSQADVNGNVKFLISDKSHILVNTSIGGSEITVSGQIFAKGIIASLTGTFTPAGTTVNGVGTRFLDELSVGDRLTISTETQIITSITNDILLTVATVFVTVTPDASSTADHSGITLTAPNNNVLFTVKSFANTALVGIGTPDPKRVLHLKTEVDGEGILLEGNKNSVRTLFQSTDVGTVNERNFAIGNDAALKAFVFTALNDDLTNKSVMGVFTHDGKFGIGITNPAELLDVAGNTKLGNSTGDKHTFNGTLDFLKMAEPSTPAAGTVRFYNLDSGLGEIRVKKSDGTTVSLEDNGASLDFWNRNAGITSIFPKTIGDKVGIGTNTPEQLLHVKDGVVKFEEVGGTGFMLLGPRSESPVSGDGVLFSYSGTVGGFALSTRKNDAPAAFLPQTYECNEFKISTGATTLTDRFFVGDDGNIGIGTITPTALLHLKTSINQDGMILESSEEVIRTIYNHTNGPTGKRAYALLTRDDDLAIRIQTLDDDLTFQNNLISFLHGGNIGIGLATTPTVQLALTDNGTGFTRTGDNKLGIFTDNVERLTILKNGNVGFNSVAPTIKVAIGSPGTGFQTSISETLGIFTNNLQRITIEPSGEVGIGTTDPIGLFHLKGNVGNLMRIETASIESDIQFIRTDVDITGWQAGMGSTSPLGANAFYLFENGKFHFTVGANGVLHLPVGGKIGVGVVAPKSIIHSVGLPGITVFLQEAVQDLGANSISLATSYAQYGGGESGNGFHYMNTFGFTEPSSTQAPAYIGFVQTGGESGKTFGDLIFGTRSLPTDTLPLERTRITAFGNMGVGLASKIGSQVTISGKFFGKENVITLLGTVFPENGAKNLVQDPPLEFLSKVSIGDRILVSGESRIVETITSDSLLTVTQNWTTDVSDFSPKVSKSGMTLVGALDEPLFTVGIFNNLPRIGVGTLEPLTGMDNRGSMSWNSRLLSTGAGIKQTQANDMIIYARSTVSGQIVELRTVEKTINRVIIVKDNDGQAETNIIIIRPESGSDLIDGKSEFIINADYGSWTFAVKPDGSWTAVLT